MPGTETKEILYISGNQEPITHSEQLPYYAYIKAFLRASSIFLDTLGSGGGRLDGPLFPSRNHPLCPLWFRHKIVNYCKSVLSKGILRGALPGIICNTRQGTASGAVYK